MNRLAFNLVVFVSLLPFSSGAFSNEVGSIKSVEFSSVDLEPIYIPSPVFPKKALLKGKQGYAVIKFTVRENGFVKDLVLINEQPKGYDFGEYSMRSAPKLQYSENIIDGTAVEVVNAIHVFYFYAKE